MSWSYNESLTTDRDKIRLRIGDVDTYEQLLSNETIDALLTVHNSDLAITAVSAFVGLSSQRWVEISIVTLRGCLRVFLLGTLTTKSYWQNYGKKPAILPELSLTEVSAEPGKTQSTPILISSSRRSRAEWITILVLLQTTIPIGFQANYAE